MAAPETIRAALEKSAAKLEEKIAEAKRITATIREDKKPAKADKPSKLNKDLVRVINASNFGCQHDSVVALVEVITGEKIKAHVGKVSSYRIEIREGAVVVPLHRPDNHDYTIGVPLLWADPDGDGSVCALRVDQGSTGNWIYNNCLRPATDAEIEAYYLATLTGDYVAPDEEARA